jgi:dTDP-4-amino-4,6-dideoxygalactose transaminase
VTTAIRTVPFDQADPLGADRSALPGLLREVAHSTDQKFLLGARTVQLERALRARTGAADVVACGSGTGGLVLALQALGVGVGDEVVVPAYGFASIAGAVLEVGATPVFADVDPGRPVLGPRDVEPLLTERTRAIVPAHLYTLLADLPGLTELADAHGIPVVEDAAVAFGSTLAGRPAGRWGAVGVWSFFPVKTFGMAGEGGAVVTDEEDLGRRVRMLRNHGQDGVHRFRHHLVGRNSRFDEVQAALQLRRLPTLDDRLARRARIAATYDRELADVAGVRTPPGTALGSGGYLYALDVDRREDLRFHLIERGVETKVKYATPLPLQPAFARYAPAGRRWPGAVAAGRRQLALPMHPGLSDEDVSLVVDAVKSFGAVG